MIERVPEIECMDTPDEAREYAAMDHGEANLAFVEALLAHGCGRGEVLDLGTGPGDIPLLLAERSDSASITAVDLSGEMLKIARLRIAEAGLSRRIRLMKEDVKALPFAGGTFRAVFSNSILHHVSDPLAFLREANRVLRPGGGLLIRDLCRPGSLAEVEALVELHCGEGTEVQKSMFRDSLKAAYTLEETRGLCDRSGLGQARIEKSSDRHLTIWKDPE